MIRTRGYDARNTFLQFNSETGEFIPAKDWDQFEGCQQCKGRALIDETVDGDLICHVCKATLPRPNT